MNTLGSYSHVGRGGWNLVARLARLRIVLRTVTGVISLLCLAASVSSQVPAKSSHKAGSMQGVVYEITPMASKIKFRVKASVPIEGTFEKWDAKLYFASPNPATGVLEITIQADSVNTGSEAKDSRLKGPKCFDAEHYPVITFRSSKIIEISPHRYEVLGTFAIRGVSKTEKLTFSANRKEEGTGIVRGNLWFSRKNYGLGGSVPFVTIADQVEVTVDFKARRISGPPLLFK